MRNSVRLWCLMALIVAGSTAQIFAAERANQLIAKLETGKPVN